MGVRFYVAGQERVVGDRLWSRMRGPLPAEDFACDGCSFSPDRLGGLKLWPACVVHDYHYRTAELRLDGLYTSETAPVPGTAAGRRYADWALYWNLYELVLAQGRGKAKAHAIASLYWGRVRVWGAKAFQHWDEGREPLSWWARIREVWG